MTIRNFSSRFPASTRRASVKLWHDRDGAAILEFALVSPAFFALLLAILNTILIYLAQEGLETAAESAARLLLTGEAQTLTLNGHTGMTATDFKNAICNGISGTDASGNAVTYSTMLPPMLTCANLTVNVTNSTSYNVTSANAPTFTYNKSGVITSTNTGYQTGSSTGGQNKVVVLQLVYLWPTAIGPLGLDLSNQPNGNRMLVASAAFTTENYSCSSSVTVC